MQIHWNQKSNISLNISLALCPSQCNHFLVFDIALIRWIFLQYKQTVFMRQNLMSKRTVFAGRSTAGMFACMLGGEVAFF